MNLPELLEDVTLWTYHIASPPVWNAILYLSILHVMYHPPDHSSSVGFLQNCRLNRELLDEVALVVL